MLAHRRISAFIVACALVCSLLVQPLAAQNVMAPSGVLGRLTLPDGRRAVVYSDGHAMIFSKDGRMYELRRIKLAPPNILAGGTSVQLPDSTTLMRELTQKQHDQAYAPGWVVVVYRTGVVSPQDVVSLSTSALVALRNSEARHQTSLVVPQYTNDIQTNRALAQLGTDRSERLFASFSRSTLMAMRSAARLPNGQQPLDFSNAYRLHLTGASVPNAVQSLAKLSSIAFVSPDWIVTPMHVDPIRIPQTVHPEMPLQAGSAIPYVPSNYGSSSSLQSLLNAPSDDVMAAYDEIQRHFHQLPGQGEIITNVSIGDVDDTTNTKDSCFGAATANGPTAELIGQQHYLNMPSMPLIAAYTTDATGNVSGSAEACDIDPSMGEVDLDFSMMAPLPHNLQRSGEQGQGFTDLLGLAPGAQYRLVVPSDPNITISDIDAAFIGAASQNPRPNIITASLGFGEDVFGFPSRYLEEDPLTEAIVSAIVHQYGIVVCIASGDGTRLFTKAAVGPSGGSAPTNIVPPGGTVTSVTDDAFSTIPSQVYDSGAIDVGGTTLDDIFAAPPQDPHFAALQSQHAFAETRWTGGADFSSGFGTRVNVSAPSDNVIAFEHSSGGAPDAVDVVIQGGTSASSPEVAAAAAVAMQVARLTGQPLTDPEKVRAFLEKASTPIPAVPQADVPLNVGPQIDLRRIVETLLEAHGIHDKPSAARVAVEQRRFDQGSFLQFSTFVSYTNPDDIDLKGSEGFPNSGLDADQYAWITVAPDWEFVPPNTTFRLQIAGKNVMLARTPWARLLPATILKAAGMPLVSTQKRTVNLTYEALQGAHVLVSVPVSLTFGPADPTVFFLFAQAPQAPPVVTGSTIPVQYDLTGLKDLTKAKLIVTEPDRGDPIEITDGTSSTNFAYSADITPGGKGSVNVPVSALQGGGIYGIYMMLTGSFFGHVFSQPSNVALTRLVSPGEKSSRPAAPLLSVNGSQAGHMLEIPYGGSFDVSYDVRNVPGASGAVLEIGAAGPTIWGIWNTFNNPNGSIRDHNGFDSGSIYFQPLPGTSGHITLNGLAAGLFPTMNHVLRVLPTGAGEAVGEAGDVSTITMDGITPLDGGVIQANFGISETGSDGLLTSFQHTASGQDVSSIETFSQGTNPNLKYVATTSDGEFNTNGWGIWGSDLGLVENFVPSSFTATFNLLDPVTGGTLGSTWTPPLGPQNNSANEINDSAANQANDTGAFLVSLGPPLYQFFTSDIAHNTFSPMIDIMGPIKSFGNAAIVGIAQDTKTNTAVLPALDFANASAPATFITVDMASGKVGSFAGPDGFEPGGIAIDSTTGKVFVPSMNANQVGIYDLATRTGSVVNTPALTGGFYAVSDPHAREFLAMDEMPHDEFTNNNSLTAVEVYDENGHLLKTLERFISPAFNWIPSNNLQLNTTTHTGYLPSGRSAQALAPFKY